MRIFLAIPGSPNPTFASSLWRANLHDPLVAMGHDVVLFEEGVQPLFDLDPADPATAHARGAFSAKLLRAVDEAQSRRRLDLVLTYLSDSHVDRQTILRIGDHDAPVLNFFCNNVHQFHLVKRTAPAYTACLVPEKTALAEYRAVGAKPIHFPMAANPETYKHLPTGYSYDVTFAGQRYGDRTTGVLALRDAGIDAHAFGQGWDPPLTDPGASRGETSLEALADDAAGAVDAVRGALAAAGRIAEQAMQGRNPVRALQDRKDWQKLRETHPDALHGVVSDSEYVALFSMSRINLGFLKLGDTHRTMRPLRQVRLREFEAPMAGGFYLTEWIEELEELYDVGKEVICWRTYDEMVDLCRYYLTHDAARDRIRQAGHARALRDHTWTRRFTDLFEALRLDGLLKR